MEETRNNTSQEFETTFRKDFTFKSPYSQHFSLPKDTINSIITNPSSSKGFQKLIKTCKYFFIKNLIIVVDYADIMETLWVIGYGKGYNYGNWETFQNYKYKFWFTYYLTFKYNRSINFNNILFQKIFRCSTIKLEIYGASCSFENLLAFKIYENLKVVKFVYSDITYSDGTFVPVEKFFEIFSNVQEFTFKPFLSFSPYYTSETVKSIIQSEKFTNIKSFKLSNINGLFDLKSFYEAMKKQKQTDFRLHFGIIYSYDYINELRNFANNIINSYSEDAYPPLIRFEGWEEEKILKKMRKQYLAKKSKHMRELSSTFAEVNLDD